MSPGYAPEPHGSPPAPRRTLAFPPAPSRIWPRYGLAMLRSDESPAYWTSGKAIAVSQVMTQGYGHDHRDKFSITLHGAGRLLYPDYNAIQYENPAIGWTRNSVAHNTLVVDERDTRNAAPTGIRPTSPRASSSWRPRPPASSRASTRPAFSCSRASTSSISSTPPARYRTPTTTSCTASAGRAPRTPRRFRPTDALVRRYWLLERSEAMTTADPWSLDFILDGPRAREKEAARPTLGGANPEEEGRNPPGTGGSGTSIRRPCG